MRVVKDPTAIPTLTLVQGERELVGSLSHLAGEDFAEAVDLLHDGVIQVETIISGRYPLACAPAVFERLSQGTLDDAVKVLLQPSSGTGSTAC